MERGCVGPALRIDGTPVAWVPPDESPDHVGVERVAAAVGSAVENGTDIVNVVGVAPPR